MDQNLTNLENSRIKTDHPRKSWLLLKNPELIGQNKVLIPFPDFVKDRGRSLATNVNSQTETLTYSRSDILNFFMAMAGNDELGEDELSKQLLKGRACTLIKSLDEDSEIKILLRELISKLAALKYSEENLWINTLTTIKVSKPINSEEITETLESDNLEASGFIVENHDFLEIFKSLLKQLNDVVGFEGAFYSEGDKNYLIKMLNLYL